VGDKINIFHFGYGRRRCNFILFFYFFLLCRLRTLIRIAIYINSLDLILTWLDFIHLSWFLLSTIRRRLFSNESPTKLFYSAWNSFLWLFLNLFFGPAILPFLLFCVSYIWLVSYLLLIFSVWFIFVIFKDYQNTFVWYMWFSS